MNPYQSPTAECDHEAVHFNSVDDIADHVLAIVAIWVFLGTLCTIVIGAWVAAQMTAIVFAADCVRLVVMPLVFGSGA